MPQKKISEETRQQAEVQYGEILGRLAACEHLESNAEQIENHQILYGWNMLTQEVSIRVAEATLKLIYQIYFDRKPPHGHSLKDLWNEIPEDAQREIAQHESRIERDQPLIFEEYDTESFQDVRYSAERSKGGKTTIFGIQQILSDSRAAASVAKEWLGEVTNWPLSVIWNYIPEGWQIDPTHAYGLRVLINEPVEPMDRVGAIIKILERQYDWTLILEFTDKSGATAIGLFPRTYCQWPGQEALADSAEECVRQIRKAYQEPSPLLQERFNEVRRWKEMGIEI